MLQFLKKVMTSTTKLLFAVFLLLLFSCDRDTPVEIVDDGIPPAKPTGLRIFRAHDGEIGIEWNHNLEKDIKFYKIFRTIDASDLYLLIDSTTATYYFDYGLEYDSTYYYKISAVDQFDNESVLSDSAFATPKNILVPLPPYYIHINARNWDDSLTFKITFSPSFSTDVDYYEIHRDKTSSFLPDSGSLIGISKVYSYTDKMNLELLEKYYYRIISVDKGGLKSQASTEVSDHLLDKPKLIFPQDNAALNYFAEFKIQTSSLPADYKLVLQTNEIYGTKVELNFTSNESNSIISVPIRNVTFEPYVDYYWRVYTYTKSNNIPNSFSELYKFTIVPGG